MPESTLWRNMAQTTADAIEAHERDSEAERLGSPSIGHGPLVGESIMWRHLAPKPPEREPRQPGTPAGRPLAGPIALWRNVAPVEEAEEPPVVPEGRGAQHDSRDVRPRIKTTLRKGALSMPEIAKQLGYSYKRVQLAVRRMIEAGDVERLVEHVPGTRGHTVRKVRIALVRPDLSPLERAAREQQETADARAILRQGRSNSRPPSRLGRMHTDWSTRPSTPGAR